MNPGDAIRNARTSALQTLMSGSAASRIHVESTLLTARGQRDQEYTRQDIEGFVRESRVVKMWAETTADPPSTTRVRHVYALACQASVHPAGVRKPDFPAWVLNLPHESGKICAIGVGGPTWDPQRQRSTALADGRAALAEALESHLRQIVEDDGRRIPRVLSETETTERALAKAETADELDAEWLDDAGVGPLGLSEVLYGMVCITR